MDGIFARLDLVHQDLQERFAKFQERMRQQLDNMHLDIESLSIRITTLTTGSTKNSTHNNEEKESARPAEVSNNEVRLSSPSCLVPRVLYVTLLQILQEQCLHPLQWHRTEPNQPREIVCLSQLLTLLCEKAYSFEKAKSFLEEKMVLTSPRIRNLLINIDGLVEQRYPSMLQTKALYTNASNKCFIYTQK